MAMGIQDDVTHIPAPKIESREIREFGPLEKEAKDHIFKAMHLVKPFLGTPKGFAGVFFYEVNQDNAEFKTLVTLDHITNRMCQEGTKELIKACMRAYGVKPPDDAKKLHG